MANLKTTRLNLDLTDQARARLEKLQAQMDAVSLSEVIRRSLATLDLLLSSEQEGWMTVQRRADGEERRVVLVY